MFCCFFSNARGHNAVWESPRVRVSRACLRRCFGFVTRRRATLHSGVVLGISRNRPTRQLVSNETHCVDTGAAPKALPMAPPKRKCFTKQRLGKHLRKTENEALGGKKKKTRPSGRGHLDSLWVFFEFPLGSLLVPFRFHLGSL